MDFLKIFVLVPDAAGDYMFDSWPGDEASVVSQAKVVVKSYCAANGNKSIVRTDGWNEQQRIFLGLLEWTPDVRLLGKNV
jgi:hypothetical protein